MKKITNIPFKHKGAVAGLAAFFIIILGFITSSIGLEFIGNVLIVFGFLFAILATFVNTKKVIEEVKRKLH